MGSEYLIDKAAQAGIADRPTGSAAETVTRIGMGFVNPAAVARQGARGVESIVDIAKAPIDRARIQAAASRAPGEEAYAPLRERLESQGILSLAVKPGGGATDVAEPLYTMEATAQNMASDMYKTRTGMEKEGWLSESFTKSPEGLQAKAATDWINTRARDYFAKQYGSPNDPLFKAFSEGTYLPPRLVPSDTFAGGYNKILPEDYEKILKAREMLRTNDPIQVLQAKQTLSYFYDKATPVSTRYTQDTIRNRLLNPRYRADIDQYIREGKNIGLDEISEYEMDSILDSYAKTGKFDSKLFEISDINSAVGMNMVDNLATKIDLQGGMYGPDLARSFGHLPDGVDVYSQAAKEEIFRGEPFFKVTSDPENKLYDRQELVNYMMNTPKEKWQRMSFPELVLAVDKDYAKITDPEVIYKRIDNYKPVTTAQRMIGTEGFMPVKSESLGKGTGWREIVDEGGILIEGRLLKHCLSEDKKYASFLKNDMSRFFSLRDNKGKAYATIQIDRLGQDGPFANIHQIKGFRNTPIADKYGQEIMDFINAYQKTIDVPLRYTEAPNYLPKEIENLSEFRGGQINVNVLGWSKGGMVDKPLYDRAQ
jgi:hypothetical protein